MKGSARSFGPKSTYCHQTQLCRRYGAPAFVLRSSQVMNDIPYGDYFRCAQWYRMHLISC